MNYTNFLCIYHDLPRLINEAEDMESLPLLLIRADLMAARGEVIGAKAVIYTIFVRCMVDGESLDVVLSELMDANAAHNDVVTELRNAIKNREARYELLQ